jgi:uncharacterized membrane-anchored protein
MTEQIGNVLVLYTFFVSLAFVVVYQLTARWWESSIGRSLMTYQIAMTLIMGVTAVTSIFDMQTNPTVQAIMLFIFSAVPVALTWRLIALVKVQRTMRNREDLDTRGD